MANPNESPNRYYAKKDDNTHTVGATLSTSSGPYSLTGTTVLLLLKGRDTGTALSITATPDADQSTNTGKVTAALTSTHLATADTYDMEWQVTNGTAILTFPSLGYDELVVTGDLN